MLHIYAALSGRSYLISSRRVVSSSVAPETAVQDCTKQATISLKLGAFVLYGAGNAPGAGGAASWGSVVAVVGAAASRFGDSVGCDELLLYPALSTERQLRLSQ